MEQVVITGMGAISPLAKGVQQTWEALLAGKSGVTQLPQEEFLLSKVKVAGLVPEGGGSGQFDPQVAFTVKERRQMGRFILFACVAAEEALRSAGIRSDSALPWDRFGTAVASGVGGFPTMTEGTRRVMAEQRLSPFFVPSFLANLAAGQLSIRHGLKGPLHAPVTACAASAQSIGLAARLIQTGEADLMLAGGSEACIDPVSLNGFAAAKAIALGGENNPENLSRPFDADRNGFVMGEGAGLVVLESLSSAKQRGANILAVLKGYGETADAFHVTSPPEDGEGARRAMELALERAGLAPEDVGYINAHATSTAVGDAAEIQAIKALFGSHAPKLSVSSTKSATGHLLGAAGALEAILSIKALQTSRLPATRNLDRVSDDCLGVDHITGESRSRQVKAVLSNAFGFGGVNASLLLTQPDF